MGEQSRSIILVRKGCGPEHPLHLGQVVRDRRPDPNARGVHWAPNLGHWHAASFVRERTDRRWSPGSRFCRVRKAAPFARFPHSLIRHQRRTPFRERSTKTHRHSGHGQALTRSRSGFEDGQCGSAARSATISRGSVDGPRSASSDRSVISKQSGIPAAAEPSTCISTPSLRKVTPRTSSRVARSAPRSPSVPRPEGSMMSARPMPLHQALTLVLVVRSSTAP